MARAKRDIPKITLKTPKLPKEPVPSNMNPTIDEFDDKGRFISRTEISRVGALGGTPNSSEEKTGINISQREGDRIQRSEYKMPTYNDDVETRYRNMKHVRNFEEGGRIADVRDDPKRGKTY